MIILKAENISKQYRLGTVGTKSLQHDLNRWYHKVRGKEDPYLQVGAVNDRSKAAEGEYVWALKDINFEVKKGEVLGIIGKNGAGKSTLLKILSRVTSPTTGSIKTKGRIASLLEVGTGFHPELTGRENIYLNGAILGMTKTEITAKIDEIIDFSGCQMYIDTPTKRYSSGMTVRLAFAVAAFLEPDILVVDEVLAVGDAEFQKKAIGKMQDISSGEGRTVLFVSHNMASVKQLCSRGILLENGVVNYEGNIHEVVSKYLFEKLPTLNINRSMGEFDLSSHEEKIRKSFGVYKAELFCNQDLSDVIYVGSEVEIILYYETDKDLFFPEIGFAIKNESDLTFMNLNNIHLGNSFKILKGKGKAKIHINSFPLYGRGTYYLNLYFGDGKDPEYECLSNAIPFKIISLGVYDSLRPPEFEWNLIYHKSVSINIV